MRGIQRITERVVDARAGGHRVDILGVVLTGVPTAAIRVRAEATADIITVLGGTAAPARCGGLQQRRGGAGVPGRRGLLAHELAEQLEGVEPFWRPLREGHTPQRVPGSATALADDCSGRAATAPLGCPARWRPPERSPFSWSSSTSCSRPTTGQVCGSVARMTSNRSP
jgi:hypothetical protein